MLRLRLQTGILFGMLIALAWPAHASESHIKIVTAVESRAKSEISVGEAQSALQVHSDALHECFWSREESYAWAGRPVESRWRVQSKGGKVRADRIELDAPREVREKKVTDCFRGILQKVDLDDGIVRVALQFGPTHREVRTVNVTDVRATKNAATKDYLDQVRSHLSVDRELRCSGPSRGEGKYTAKLEVSPDATSVYARADGVGSLSCNLGLDRRVFPVHPKMKKSTFEVDVVVSSPKPRRSFTSRKLYLSTRDVPKEEVKFVTQFSDAEVWTSEGQHSTRYLGSVCRALPSVEAETRFQKGCSMVGCPCQTEIVKDDWGEFCQPYIDAGRPDRDDFIEDMFRGVLAQHQRHLSTCGDACARYARDFEKRCADYLTGGDQ